MKKMILLLVISIIFTLLVVPVNVLASTTDVVITNVNFFVNGNSVALEREPVAINGRILAPARTVFKDIGAKVDWYPQKGMFTIIKGSTVISMTIGHNNAIVNNVPTKLEVPPILVRGTVMAPVRFVAETLKTEVSWDGNNRAVYVGERGNPASSRGERQYVVVIDPGHGGRETGAVYGGIKEKDLNLDIAKKLQTLLKAELGTRKVINEHSTIGLLVTTDGSITEIQREEYIEAEKRVVNELKSIKKPFIIILNSTKPYANETIKLRDELEEKYMVPVLNVNVAQMRIEDINNIMEKVLFEFPICEIGINLPDWIDALDNNHWLRIKFLESIKETFMNVKKIREVRDIISKFNEFEFIKKAYIERIDLGSGNISMELSLPDELFYKVISELTGLEIEGDRKLVGLMKDLAKIKKEYERVEYALHEVKVKGYGIVTPKVEELSLEEPEIIKQGNRFGVRLRASAPSIHMIRADIETEIAPLVGSEKQSEELVDYLLKEFESEPGKIWDSNIFGKSLHDLVSEGLYNKLNRMPEDSRLKLQETLQRIINEGSGGLICIIL
jgi:stage IV sporulation protein A